MSCDWSLVTRERSVAEYLLLHGQVIFGRWLQWQQFQLPHRYCILGCGCSSFAVKCPQMDPKEIKMWVILQHVKSHHIKCRNCILSGYC